MAESTRENRLNTNLECDTNIIIDLPSNETPKIQNTILETDDKIDNFIYSSDEEYDTNFQDLTIHSRFPEVSSRENEEILKDNENGSIWNQIPYGISERILEILCDIDTIGYLHQVSKHFFLIPKDEIYHIICKYIYTSQSYKKTINLLNWGTWRNMCINRSRIRTNGFYSLRMSYWKPPNNDAFWEEKRTEFIEVKIFRHMRFYNNGLVLYSLCHNSPNKIAKSLREGKSVHKKVKNIY